MIKKFAAFALGFFLVTNANATTISFAGDSISKGMGDSGNYSSGGIVGAGVTVGNR